MDSRLPYSTDTPTVCFKISLNQFEHSVQNSLSQTESLVFVSGQILCSLTLKGEAWTTLQGRGFYIRQ